MKIEKGILTILLLGLALLFFDSTVYTDPEVFRISAEHYWFFEKYGNIRDSKIENDIMQVMIFEHHGPARYWLPVEELNDQKAKTRGYRLAVQVWAGFLRSSLVSEQEWGIQQFQKNFSISFPNANDWLDWYDENMEFLLWDDEQGQFMINEERKAKHLAEDVDGLRLSFETDKKQYKVGEPVAITVRLERADPASGEADGLMWLNTRLLWNEEIKVELRSHEYHDVSYWHLQSTPPSPPLARDDFRPLEAGENLEKSFVVSEQLAVFPLKPGRYSIKVQYINEEDGAQFGLEGPAWRGTLESLTEFFEVVE